MILIGRGLDLRERAVSGISESGAGRRREPEGSEAAKNQAEELVGSAEERWKRFE